MKNNKKINKKFAGNNIKKHQNGITLVALVVTIIVLIILAGVSINLVLGDNGIITKAKDARENFMKAADEEGTRINELYAEINERTNGAGGQGGSGGGAGENTITAGQTATGGNKNYSDGTDTAIIPKGFTVSGISTEQTVANGLVIYDLEGDTVSDWNADTNTNSIPDVQENYNQYVWVPVTGSLARYEGYYNGSLDSMLSSCSEPLNKDGTTAAEWETTEHTAMKNSVESNHGFYIARYEASKNTSTNKAESKKGKAVWNNIAWGTSMTEIGTGAVYNAEQVYNNNSSYNVTSTLIYGSEWDAVLAWIDPSYKTGTCESTSFIVNSTGHGNYSDTKSTYGTPGNTGIFDVKNIYDMAGNVYEWTMEAYYTNCRVPRGGYYSFAGSDYPVSSRTGTNPANAHSYRRLSCCFIFVALSPDSDDFKRL